MVAVGKAKNMFLAVESRGSGDVYEGKIEGLNACKTKSFPEIKTKLRFEKNQLLSGSLGHSRVPLSPGSATVRVSGLVVPISLSVTQ